MVSPDDVIDPTSAVEASAAVVRAFVEVHGGDAAVADLLLRFFSRLGAGDFGALADLVADDVVWIDRSLVSLPDTTGRDAFVAMLEPLYQSEPRPLDWIADVHRMAAAGAVTTVMTRLLTEDGDPVEWVNAMVAIVDGGRYVRFEKFDEADLPRALARFDELSRGPARRGPAP